LLSSLLTVGIPDMTSAGKDDKIWVHFANPRDGQEAAGEIVLEAEVLAAAPIRDVVFFVDGQPVGQMITPPYRMRYNLGEENRSHTIEVVATDTAGRQARQSVTTVPLPVGTVYEVKLQQLYVTVTRDGERVLDLTRDDFTVLDERKKESLVTFERGDIPFTAVLLIDSSASMYGSKLEAARAGATTFIEGMRELDQGKVTVFSDVIQNSTSFSSIREVLTAGLIGATGQGGTAVNDNLYSALKLLETRQGRRLIVLLSDGIDSHSVLDGEDVLNHARRSQAMVYWIRLLKGTENENRMPDMASSWRTRADYRRQSESLRELVELSGGRIIPARSTDEIEPVFIEILRELREQYALGYYPSVQRNDGSWRRITVRIDRPGVKVRTHEGYLDL
jgi:Ca-activated chloride channel family protein